MFFVLSKVLGVLAKPFSWLVLLLIVALFVRKSRKKYWIGAALLLAVLFSNDAVLYYAAGWWQKAPYAAEKIEEPCDYGVLLTGTGSYSEKHQSFFFSEASDRFIQTVRLYQQGYIRKILITGGSGQVLDQQHKEAVYLKALMEDYQIPAEDILTDTEARNTYENARHTAALLDEQPHADILLITSALHMRRALACFQKQGLSPRTFPVDVIIKAPEKNPDYWLVPSAEMMTKWEAVLHEWLGMIAYRLAGYV